MKGIRRSRFWRTVADAGPMRRHGAIDSVSIRLRGRSPHRKGLAKGISSPLDRGSKATAAFIAGDTVI
jgi:hypothetical protein